MDEINKFAKDNDLAQKFERAIMNIDRGRGWAPFAGLEKGEITVKVVYNGQIRFVALEKPKPKKKVTAKPPKEPDEEIEPVSGWPTEPTADFKASPDKEE